MDEIKEIHSSANNSMKHYEVLKNFIAIEGPDGNGKSTMIYYLKPLLENYYGTNNIVFCNDPSSEIVIAKDIRGLLKCEANNMAPEVRSLMYLSARKELLEKFILPNLAAGKIVVSDRFFSSTYAYQGLDIPISNLLELNRIIGLEYVPELEIILMSKEGFKVESDDSIEECYNSRRKIIINNYEDYAKHMVEIDANFTNIYNMDNCKKININNMYEMIKQNIPKVNEYMSRV